MKTEILNNVVLPFGCTVLKIKLKKVTSLNEKNGNTFTNYLVTLNNTVIKTAISETFIRRFLNQFIENVLRKPYKINGYDIRHN